MKWYYAQGGSQKGPVEDEELRAKIASGEVASGDLVWREGMKDWLPSSEVAELSRYAAAPAGGAGTAAPGGTPAVTPQAASVPDRMPTGASPYQAPQAGGASGGGLQAPIPNYLWQSIVVTIFCCWPLGIPAIVFAAKVDGLVSRGQIAEAQEASKNAKMWTWIAFGSGLAAIILYIGFAVLAAANGASQM
jgi:hypothetical protein